MAGRTALSWAAGNGHLHVLEASGLLGGAFEGQKLAFHYKRNS